jgi:hypothetical protein
MPPRAWQILPAIVFSVLTATAVAQTAKEVAILRDVYQICSTNAANRYAVGSDAADLLAKSATEACAADRKAFTEGLIRAGGAPAENMTDQFDAQLVRQLKLLILERRATK